MSTPRLSRADLETLSLTWAVAHAGDSAQTVCRALGLDPGLAPEVERALHRLDTVECVEGVWTPTGAGRARLAEVLPSR